MKWFLACVAVALFAIVPAGAKANVFTKLDTPGVAAKSAGGGAPVLGEVRRHRRSRTPVRCSSTPRGPTAPTTTVTITAGQSVEFAYPSADNAHNVKFGVPGGADGPNPSSCGLTVGADYRHSDAAGPARGRRATGTATARSTRPGRIRSSAASTTA